MARVVWRGKQRHSLTATIAPARAHDDTTVRETREIQAEGADYDSAKAALQGQVQDGAQLLYIRQFQ